MHIRTAQTSDAGAITDIWNLMIKNTLWTFTTQLKSTDSIVAQIEAAKTGKTGFLIAEDTSGVLGFMTYFQFRGGPGYAFTVEHSIVLDDHARGKGAGKALMKAGEQSARAKGHHSMIGGISSANPRGKAFHLAIGYTHIATLPEVGFKSGQWLDLDLVQKIL